MFEQILHYEMNSHLTKPEGHLNWINMETDSNMPVQYEPNNSSRLIQSHRRQSSIQRRSTSSHNFQAPTIPPSMPPTLPSMAYYSLNRNMNRNNLNITNYYKYHTLAHANTAINNRRSNTISRNNTTIRTNTSDISYSDFASTKE